MSEVGIGRIRELVRQLHTAVSLDASQLPPKKVPAETRYEEAGDGWWHPVIDLDEDGNEVTRQWVPNRKVGHGLEPAQGDV